MKGIIWSVANVAINVVLGITLIECDVGPKYSFLAGYFMGGIFILGLAIFMEPRKVKDRCP